MPFFRVVLPQERNMDDMKAPLLRKLSFSKLPLKVLSALDPEIPFDLDLSKLTGFSIALPFNYLIFVELDN